jgi:very-short-patch-repair endonuclease
MQLGYRVVHIANHDVMTNMDGLLQLLVDMLSHEAKPHPTPSPEGEGPKTARDLTE